MSSCEPSLRVKAGCEGVCVQTPPLPPTPPTAPRGANAINRKDTEESVMLIDANANCIHLAAHIRLMTKKTPFYDFINAAPAHLIVAAYVPERD